LDWYNILWELPTKDRRIQLTLSTWLNATGTTYREKMTNQNKVLNGAPGHFYKDWKKDAIQWFNCPWSYYEKGLPKMPLIDDHNNGSSWDSQIK